MIESGTPAAALLRGAGLPALAVTVAGACFSLLHTPASSASYLLGAALATAALATGPLFLRVGREYTGPGLMALAVCGYGLVVLLLGLAFLLVDLIPWLDGEYAGVGAVVAAVAWLAGQARSTSRLRVLPFGSPTTTESTREGNSGLG